MIKLFFQSKLFQTASIYTISRVINSAIPFLLIPVFTRFLTPADYGIVAMFAVVTGLINPFIGLNMPGSIGLKYYERETIDLPRYIGTCFQIVIVSTLVMSGLLWLCRGLIGSVTMIPQNWILAVIVVSAGQFVIQTNMILWQVKMQPVPFGIFQNLQTIINIGLSILLVVALGMNWQGRIISQVVTFTLFAAIGFIILYRHKMVTFSFHRLYAISALKFGFPLIVHDLGSLLICQTDRMLIANMVSISDAGIYSVGILMMSVIELLASSFNQAFSPWLFKQLSDSNGFPKDKIVRYTYLYFVIIFLFSLSFALIMPYILHFFVGKDFRTAAKYTIWLALGFSFSGMYYMVANYIIYTARTGLLALVTIITGVVNILCTYLLIKKNGPIGAAQATFIAYFLSFILTWLISSRVYRMPWNPLKAFASHQEKNGGTGS